MAAVCLQCTVGDDVVEFPNMLALRAHEMTGHQSRPEKVLPVDPRGDHPSATELKAMAEGKLPAVKTPVPNATQPAQPAAAPDTPPVPLKLQYEWKGQCPTCRDNAKTIEVDLEKHSLIIAYCVRCDKKLMQKKVIPLSQQLGVTPDTFERNLKGK